MKNFPQEGHCLFGPYQGYLGRADYDMAASLFHGNVIGTRDVVTFQGKDFKDVATAFKDSVDDYLEFCRSRGEQPDKPFSGKFVARIEPETHRRLSLLAEAEGKSLNQLLREVLESVAATDTRRSAKPRRAPRPPAVPPRRKR